jgi:hypothetical protein
MWCCCHRREKKQNKEEKIDVTITWKNKKIHLDDYIYCELCQTPSFSQDVLEKHREGKRHRKALSHGNIEEKYSWVRRPQKEESLSESTSNTVTERPRAEETNVVSLSKDEKGWQRVGSSVKSFVNPLVCLVGERNILFGCLNIPNFLSLGAESKVLQYLESATEAAIKGRLRGTTYQSRHKPTSQGVSSVSLQLSFGCAIDFLNSKPIKVGKVEPIPNQLRDIGRRISARSDILEVHSLIEPDCLTVFDLREGDYLPPSIAGISNDTGFTGPVYIVSLSSSTEDILLGGVRSLDTIGEFSALYAHRLSRRGLLKLDAGSTNWAVPRVSSRLVLLVFRKLNEEVRLDQISRGNLLE